jgi:hypothetical protein
MSRNNPCTDLDDHWYLTTDEHSCRVYCQGRLLCVCALFPGTTWYIPSFAHKGEPPARGSRPQDWQMLVYLGGAHR